MSYRHIQHVSDSIQTKMTWYSIQYQAYTSLCWHTTHTTLKKFYRKNAVLSLDRWLRQYLATLLLDERSGNDDTYNL